MTRKSYETSIKKAIHLMVRMHTNIFHTNFLVVNILFFNIKLI